MLETPEVSGDQDIGCGPQYEETQHPLAVLTLATEPGMSWRFRLWRDVAVTGSALGMEGTDLAELRRGCYREEAQLEPTV